MRRNARNLFVILTVLILLCIGLGMTGLFNAPAQARPMATPAPTNTPTHTPVPTNTPLPTKTNTPVPTFTFTPSPTPAPDLVVSGTQVPGGTHFKVGDTGQFTITVTNQGNAPTTAGSITVNLTIPAGIATTAVASGGWACPATTVQSGTQNIQCVFTGNLNAGAA